jgi:hypothetical protein
MNQCPPGPQVLNWGRMAGVVDTGDKLFTDVDDTAIKLFRGVNDTGDLRVLPILACLHIKIKNKQKYNL